MNGPLVSIVTPTLNPGQRLARCVQSVRGQTYNWIEHIVVDGGSNDGTLDFLRSNRSIRWLSESDDGQSDAINKGFAMARGEYMGWLNADDLLTPWAIEKTILKFARNPNAGWSVGDVIVRGKSHAELERPALIDKESRWRARNLAAQPGSLTAKWALDKVGGLDPSFHLMMDLDLWLRLLAQRVEHVYVPEVVAVFELHEDSKSGSISHAEFLLEDGRARTKVGRYAEGSFAYGRAMAWTSSPEPRRWLERQLGPDVANLQEDLIALGFKTERVVLEAKGSLLGAVGALNPRLWWSELARSRLIHAVGRMLSRSRRKRLASQCLAGLDSRGI